MKTRKSLPDLLTFIHQTSQEIMSSLLSIANLTLLEYLFLLDEFHRYNLINSASTITWCENCNLEFPLFSSHHGNIAPSKIANAPKNAVTTLIGRSFFRS